MFSAALEKEDLNIPSGPTEVKQVAFIIINHGGQVLDCT